MFKKAGRKNVFEFKSIKEEWVFLCFLIFIVIFSLFFGFFLGDKRAETQETPIILVKSIISDTPDTNVDISVFWQVWNTIKERYVDRKDVDESQLMEGAINGLVYSLEDPFSEFLNEENKAELDSELEGSFEGIGAEITKKENAIVIVSPLAGSPAQKAGLRAQDIILEVNGESTRDWTTNDVVKKVRGKRGTEVNLLVYRESTKEELEIVVKRGLISLPSVDFEMLDDSIALVKIYNFYEPLVKEFDDLVAKLKKDSVKGIVIDLRSNPGGYLDTYVIMGNHFFKKGKKLLIEDYNSDRPTKVYRTEINGELRDKPMIVLVNEGTASAAEILAGSLRDNRNIKIVGKDSFGKGSVQELIPLSGGNQLKLTIAKWLTPNGYSISEEGIKPDYEVELPEDYYQGKSSFEIGNLTDDVQLKKAYEVLKNQIK